MTLWPEIRRVDGDNSLGAGELAEALMPFITARPVTSEINIIFKSTGDPQKGPPSLEFIECENDAGRSISVGEWIVDGEYEALRLQAVTP